MKTTLPKDPGENRQWKILDADGKVLGRLAVKVADLLRGRDKPTFSPQVDTGVGVIVINAAKVKLTGKKEDKKLYHRFSGFPGGLKTFKASFMRERHPDRMILEAVKGMLPRNTMSRALMSRLRVFAGETHSHEAQKPVKVD